MTTPLPGIGIHSAFHARLLLLLPPPADAREAYLASSEVFQGARGFRARNGATTPRLDGGWARPGTGQAGRGQAGRGAGGEGGGGGAGVGDRETVGRRRGLSWDAMWRVLTQRDATRRGVT